MNLYKWTCLFLSTHVAFDYILHRFECVCSKNIIKVFEDTSIWAFHFKIKYVTLLNICEATLWKE